LPPEPEVEPNRWISLAIFIGSGAGADEIFLNWALKKGMGQPWAAEKSGGRIERGFASQEREEE
jgi:hypothetical protein